MKRERHVLLFVATVIVISMITGFIFGINNDYNIDAYLNSLVDHNVLFLNDFLIIILFMFATLSLVGIIINTLVIGIEGVSIGYIIGLFYKKYAIKGVLYSIVAVTINKLFFMIILMYLFITCYIYVKKSLRNIFGLNNDYVKSMIVPLIKKYAVITLIVFIYDIIIYFLGNMFLNYLTFML